MLEVVYEEIVPNRPFLLREYTKERTIVCQGDYNECVSKRAELLLSPLYIELGIFINPDYNPNKETYKVKDAN